MIFFSEMKRSDYNYTKAHFIFPPISIDYFEKLHKLQKKIVDSDFSKSYRNMTLFYSN